MAAGTGIRMQHGIGDIILPLGGCGDSEPLIGRHTIVAFIMDGMRDFTTPIIIMAISTIVMMEVITITDPEDPWEARLIGQPMVAIQLPLIAQQPLPNALKPEPPLMIRATG